MNITETYLKTGKHPAFLGWLIVLFAFAPYTIPAKARQPAGAPLGSIEFVPTPERPLGWRGDGTGKFPGATPPVEWGRTVDGCNVIMSRASAPSASSDTKGILLVRGTIAEGLMLGPVKDIGTLGNLAGISPKEGDTLAGLQWKLVTRDKPNGAKKAPAVALRVNKKEDATYLYFTHLFADQAGNAAFSVQDDKDFKNSQVWLNGAPATGAAAEFKKGWNKVLLRTTITPEKETVAVSVTSWRNAENYKTKNIAWICRMTGESGSMPLIIGNRIYVTTDISDLMCLDKATGKTLWIRSTTSAHIASQEEKANQAYKDKLPELIAKLDKMNAELVDVVNKCNVKGYQSIAPSAEKRAMDELIAKQTELERQVNEQMCRISGEKNKSPDKQHCGFANATPVSDGRNIWVYYPGYATAAMYDLDGKLKWGQGLWRGTVEHGNHGSPALVGDKLFVPAGENIVALKSATGEIVWETRKLGAINYGSVVPFRMSGEPYLLLCNGVVLKAGDGTVASKSPGLGFPWGTPVVDNGIACATGRDNATGTWIGEIPAKIAESSPISWKKTEGETGAESCVASPLLLDGIAYVAQMCGMVKTFDAKTRKALWQEFPDWEPWENWVFAPGACASPTLAGKYVYLFGNDGKGVVLEPGKTFKVVAINTLDNIQCVGQWNPHPEQVICNPAFEGSRIYLHGPEYLYCIGAK